MRILLCNWKDLEHPRAGGAEVWTHGIAAAWVADGHQVTLACAAAPGRAPVDARDGVAIVRGGAAALLEALEDRFHRFHFFQVNRLSVGAHARHVYEAHDRKFDLVFDEINTRPFFAPRWATESGVVAFIHQIAREVWFREAPLPVAIAGRNLVEPKWLRGYRDVCLGALSASTAES